MTTASSTSESSSQGDETTPCTSHAGNTPVKPWKFDPVEPSLYTGPMDEGLPLPPIDYIMPIVDHYFKTFNQVLPLFDQADFMRRITGFYAHTIPRDNVLWAAILMVCAMGLRSPVSGDIATLGFNSSVSEDKVRAETQSKMEWANHCMRNAQGVMSELCTREEDLLGLQTLLALVLQFHNSSDSRPASVLMGPAVRLAHRLQLHAASSTKNFSEGEGRQRNRVFWVTYLLDKAGFSSSNPHVTPSNNYRTSLFEPKLHHVKTTPTSTSLSRRSILPTAPVSSPPKKAALPSMSSAYVSISPTSRARSTTSSTRTAHSASNPLSENAASANYLPCYPSGITESPPPSP